MRSRHREAFQIVQIDRVRVRIDNPREDQKPRRIDDIVARKSKVLPDSSNATVLNRNV
jgi:hypothetical protein